MQCVAKKLKGPLSEDAGWLESVENGHIFPIAGFGWLVCQYLCNKSDFVLANLSSF